MNTVQTPELFLPLRRAAARLGVPAAWLRKEALAGRIPFVRAGRRILLNVDQVAQALTARAVKGGAYANE